MNPCGPHGGGQLPFQRVSRRNPCPVCGHPDWCGISPDGVICICMRVEQGSIGQSRNDGYIHRLHQISELPHRPRVRRIRLRETAIGEGWLTALARQCFENTRRLQALADDLKVSKESLLRLRVGWSTKHQAWTFPMVDANGNIVGLRLRLPSGRKLSVRGGHEGIFVPDRLGQCHPLLITEGPTDAAALLDMGFDVVGRPSCIGGIEHAVNFVRNRFPLSIVVVADGDVPGRNGAQAFASRILPFATSVRIISPPAGAKDARVWKTRGGTRSEVLTEIAAAHTQRFAIAEVRHER